MIQQYNNNNNTPQQCSNIIITMNNLTTSPLTPVAWYEDAGPSLQLYSGEGRYTDDKHKRIWCLNPRDELYRSTFDLYSRRKGQISDALVTEMNSTDSFTETNSNRLSFTDSTNSDRLSFIFKGTKLDTLSFTEKNSDRLIHKHDTQCKSQISTSCMHTCSWM